MKGDVSARAQTEGGFTLIEVVIAMVILSVGLLALEALGIYASRMVARAQRESMYVANATSYLETVSGQIRTGQAITALTPVPLSDGAVLTWQAQPTSATLSRVQVKVVPPARSTDPHAAAAVMTHADSLVLSVDVFVPPPAVP